MSISHLYQQRISENLNTSNRSDKQGLGLLATSHLIAIRFMVPWKQRPASDSEPLGLGERKAMEMQYLMAVPGDGSLCTADNSREQRFQPCSVSRQE